MKKVFLMFLVSLRFGVITVVLWTGSASAQLSTVPPVGGLPECQAALNTCNADLSTCNTDLGSCTTDLSNCNGNLGTCQSNLTQAQEDLNTCNNDLAACQAQPVCGDGEVEGTEECDLNNLNGATCVTEGFLGGTLTCATGCTFDTSGCFANRFVDNLDGTVTDNQTGLMWEKKGGGIHDPNIFFTWTDTSDGDFTDPDGTAFTVFLHTLNNCTSGNGSTVSGGFAGHCDWRLPQIDELRTILDCTFAPFCINPIFGPIGGATGYWSATTAAFTLNAAWLVIFHGGFVGVVSKDVNFVARAVRNGS